MLLTLLSTIIPAGATESRRERHLSREVDRLEMALAKSRRETEAARIRLAEERAQFAEHRLNDYPASGHWVRTVHNLEVHGETFQNPIEFVLSDVEELGYDVSAAWMYLDAMLIFLRRYQEGVHRLILTAGETRHQAIDLRDSADARIRLLQ